MKKKILGLDIGTNSIGWALIEKDEKTNEGRILGMNSRIISLGEDKTNFEQGKALTRNAVRREKRGSRKLNKRYKQRRNKLIYVLHQLGLLPDNQFEFKVDREEYRGQDGKFPKPEKLQHLSIIPKRNLKKEDNKWKQFTALELYQLRWNSIFGNEKLDERDLGRLIYLFNQLRGYAGGGEFEDQEEKKEEDTSNEIDNTNEPEQDSHTKEYETVIVSKIEPKQKFEEKKLKGEIIEVSLFKVQLKDIETGEIYVGESYVELQEGDKLLIQIIKKSTEDKHPFFNAEASEWKKPKPRKGGEEKNITAEILSCEKPQEYSGKKWYYRLTLKDGRTGDFALKKTEWAKDYKEGVEKELLVITKKETGKTTYEFAVPQKSNWRKRMEELNKRKQEAEKEKGRTVYLCELFLDDLKRNKWERIRNQVILRKHYIEEFDKIWEIQLSKNPDLKKKIEDPELIKKIANYLFPGSNPNYKQAEFREAAINEGIKYIIKEQIIYYQRPLKPQFKLIGQCQFEKVLKVIPQSHPLHQEEKIWKGINSLSIVRFSEINGKKRGQEHEISTELKETLFQELQAKPSLSYSQVRNNILILAEKDEWLKGLNPKAKLKGNETRIAIKNAVGEILFEEAQLHKTENLIELWRILYNWVKKEYDDTLINIKEYEASPKHFHVFELSSKADNEYDPQSERCKAIRNYFHGKNIDLTDEQILKIAKVRFKRAYSSLSSKALGNILPLVRAGKYFKDETNVIPQKAREEFETLKGSAPDMLDRIEEGVNVGYDKAFLERINKGDLDNLFEKGELIYSDAVSLVYKKHTAEETLPENAIKDYHQIKTFWKRKNENPDDQRNYLRNPVVEQITDEVLQLFISLCKQYKFKTKDNPDEEIEVHIELARELKNNAEEREQMYKAVLAGEKENNRVRQRLRELKQSEPPENTIEIEGTEPSLSNIEKYKVWKKQLNKKEFKEEPDKSEIERYKLWEQQGLLSPYTMKPIPLSRLFSKDYEIDHIIPKSRYFDDSMANKVVCETLVNKDKSNRTPYEYFNAHPTHPDALNWNSFIDHVNSTYSGLKRKYLTSESIPDDFINRQIKETQYVSLKVKEELGKIVGTKNVRVTTGGITDYLRNQWGLTDKFKRLTEPRYRLMEQMTGQNLIEEKWDEEKRKNVYKNTLWSKRNDHRHHAIDALIVACTEQRHVQQLNNLNKNLQSWFAEFDLWIKENRIEELKSIKNADAKEILIAFSKIEATRRKEIEYDIYKSFTDKQEHRIKQTGNMQPWFDTFNALQNGDRDEIIKVMPGFRNIEQPWKDFYKDQNIENWVKSMVISHKPNSRLQIQQRENNKKEKQDFLRIRGRLHEDNLYGKGEVYRFPLSKFGQKNNLKKFIEEKVISKKLSRQLLIHLTETYKGDAKKAFSAEGIKAFNDERQDKGLRPVRAVTVLYAKDNNDEEGKLQPLNRLGYDEKSILIKTGSNYCLGVVEKNGKRVFDEISLFDAAQRIKEVMKNGQKNINEVLRKYFEEECEKTKHSNDKATDSKLLFTLAINDMVFMPDIGELVPTKETDEDYLDFWKKANPEKIYRVVKITKGECYFIPHTFSKELVYKQINSDEDSISQEYNSEDKTNKAKSISEFSDGNCTRYLHDESKVVNLLSGRELKSEKKKLIGNLKTIIDKIIKSKDDTVKQDELKSSLVDFTINNILLNPIDEIKKIDISLFNWIKQIIQEHKQNEINNLIVEIQNSNTESENKLAELLIEFEKFGLKKYLKEKNKNIDKRITEIIKKKKQESKEKKYDPIRIQDYCIKLSVDRLGNIRPAKNEFYNGPAEPENILSEPQAPYQTNSLKSFTSFEDMENDQLNYFASLQPNELLQNLKQLVLSAFGFRTEPPLSSLPRIIHFNDEA